MLDCIKRILGGEGGTLMPKRKTLYKSITWVVAVYENSLQALLLATDTNCTSVPRGRALR